VAYMLTAALDDADWTSPPDAMEFQIRYGDLVETIAENVQALKISREERSAARTEKAVLLYIMAPGIVNVMLNYKICVEHNLPLHPSVYYELKEARKYRIDHGLPAVEKANRLYRESIELARKALRLDDSFKDHKADFLSRLPEELKSFVYTGVRDLYTWRGSQPALLQRLTSSLKGDFEPDIIVAAAHGAIMPALLLAELLAKPLYFIRFSMFKRQDEEPIVSFSDKAWLSAYADGKALLYDEDVAGGRTLSLFSHSMQALFAQTRTACSIRHAGSAIRPDYSARTWWE